jgi:peptidyl-prolyl cis-trans isomerase C
MDNKVLAVVAENEITSEDLNRIIMRYPEDKRGYFESEQGRNQLLDQTISFELMSKLGEELALDKTKDFQDTLKALGKELLTQVTINKVLSEVTVTDEEVQKYYEDNKENFKEEATVSAKHILVETEEEAKKAKEEIVSEAISFEDAAMKYSTCPSNQEGGNLGPFKKGMMVPEFEEVAFNLEVGKVSEPVKTQFGYHLILVDNKNEAKQKSYDEVKDSVINQLTQVAQQKKYQDLVVELEKKYGVDRK